MIKVSVIVPVYNIEEYIERCLDSLVHQDLKDMEIIVVNDGSIESKKIFEKVQEYPNVDLLEYEENRGKGYALKYGINYYLENLKDKYKGIVTVDADLQHQVEDIINISLKLIGNPDSLILGSRNFK